MEQTSYTFEFRSYTVCSKNDADGVTKYAERHEGRLEDLEDFLQFDHQLPVGLDEVVTEIVLARVDTRARYLAD